MKENQHLSLEEVDMYKMAKKKLEKNFLVKEVATKAKTSTLVDPLSAMICLETQRRLFMTTKEEFLFCLLQTTTSDSQYTNTLLKYVVAVYLGLMFSVEKSILK